MRFPFGTVANLQPPPPERRLLGSLTRRRDSLRVKVTQAHDEHILLAAADRIRWRSQRKMPTGQLPTRIPDGTGDERGGRIWTTNPTLGEQVCRRTGANLLNRLFSSRWFIRVLRQVMTNILAAAIGHRR